MFPFPSYSLDVFAAPLSGLRKLDLENKGITVAGMRSLGRGVPATLIIATSSFDTLIVRSVVAVLAQHPCLSTLILSRNAIGGTGLSALLSGIASHPHSPLTELVLTDCEVTLVDHGLCLCCLFICVRMSTVGCFNCGCTDWLAWQSTEHTHALRQQPEWQRSWFVMAIVSLV